MVPYKVLNYVDRMELAYAAADLVVCRAGANTVTEVSGVGLPAIYVPLPHGNGEQALNAKPVVDAGGGLLVDNADGHAGVGARDRSATSARPRASDAMSTAARGVIRTDADDRLAQHHPRCGEVCFVIVTAPDTHLPAEKLGRVHFVGIGGAGMSGIARIMAARGIEVSGSDAKDCRCSTALRALGATCWVGHAAEHVAEADTVVVSTAIRETNPEVVAALAAGIPILPRAAALASVMVGRRTIAVAGTHGKTTTTSMLTVALQHCGADPSFAIGGNLNESGSNAHDGSGDLFVAEADESDKSFLTYSPEVSIVTSVEPDHLDNYGDEASYRLAFERSATGVIPGGFMVICVDDAGARRLAEFARARGIDVRTYGEAPDADTRVTEITAAGRDRVVRTGVPRPQAADRAAAAGRQAQRAERRRGADRRARARLLHRRSGRGTGVVHRHRPAVRVQGRRGRRPGLRLLRAPPDRAGRRPDRGPPGRGGGARDRLLPAAPVQPDPDLRGRVLRGARAGRRGRRDGRLRGPRGSRSPVSPAR